MRACVLAGVPCTGSGSPHIKYTLPPLQNPQQDYYRLASFAPQCRVDDEGDLGERHLGAGSLVRGSLRRRCQSSGSARCSRARRCRRRMSGRACVARAERACCRPRPLKGGEESDGAGAGERVDRVSDTYAHTHPCPSQLCLSVRRSFRRPIARLAARERRASDYCCFSFRPSFRVYRARRDGEREKETEN